MVKSCVQNKRIKQWVQISEGQIIRAILYCKYSFVLNYFMLNIVFCICAGRLVTITHQMDLSGFYPPANPKPGSSTDSPAGGAMAGASAPPVAEDAPPPYTTLPRSPSEAGASPWIGKVTVFYWSFV